MTICPKRLQCAYVSTTTSPVTHTDVVAVNSAVKIPVLSPSAVANGSIKRRVPKKIAIKKLKGIKRSGAILICLRFINFFIIDSPFLTFIL